MYRPDSTDDLAETAAWLEKKLQALEQDEEPPEPPENIKRRQQSRRADRRARQRKARLIDEGVYERVPADKRCRGLGPTCFACGQMLPASGEESRRCPEGGVDL